MIEAGWSPEKLKFAPSRLLDFAAAELASPPTPPGIYDRLGEAIEALAEAHHLPLDRVSLIEARSLYPLGWRRLLDALERTGVMVDQYPDRTPACETE